MDDDGNEVVKVRTRRGGREGRTVEWGEEESGREVGREGERYSRASRLTSAFDDERGRIRGSFASSSATPGAFNGGEKSLSALPPGRNLARNSAIFASRAGHCAKHDDSSALARVLNRPRERRSRVIN